MRVVFYFIIGSIFIFSCKSEKHEIHDIWVGQYKLTLYYDSESMSNDIPYLLDLREPEKAKIKYLPGREIETTWNLSNKILTIDSVEYRLVSLSEDSLVYYPYMEELEKPDEENIEEEISEAPFKDEYYVFRRIKKVNIPFSTDSIKNILSNKIWLNENDLDKTKLNYADWFEFLDNGIALMKMDVDFNQKGKLETHVQSECWNIETYDNYHFLVFNKEHVYQKGFQGNISFANQITHLETNNIGFDYFLYNTKKTNFELYIPSDNQVQCDKLYGNWISHNDTSKFYARRYSKRSVSNGTLLLFDKALTYELKKDTLKIIPENFEPIICNWRINSDGTIFVFEYRVLNEYYDGYFVEFAKFKMESENSFELDLYYNHMQTGLEKPRAILFNKFQTFERIK